jgi:lipopolysaccharide/colanic/teichoic acid biosynthesis glycosyltransferase
LKRFTDFIISFFGLLAASPILMPVILLVWIQDLKSPFYIAQRVGKDGKQFKMVKLRSMIVNADSTGVDSTSANDTRITPIGHIIRKFKLDELTQLWNVFKGDMSLVGPRPNVKAETDIYTTDERVLLSARPGITDFSSIVFSDEGSILENKEDPDLAYNQLIRPWKSRLGLVYLKNQTFMLDMQLIFCTVLAIFSRSMATTWVTKKLQKLDVDKNLVIVSKRESELYPFPPPGSDKIVESR